MSWKKWTSDGEPDEPEFQQPELLSTALNSLSPKMNMTVEALCKELHFTADTFAQVTGVLVRSGSQPKNDVIPFNR
jgi:hypothetical protein